MTDLDVGTLRHTLETVAADSSVTEETIEQKRAYMRNQFDFLGLTSPVLRQATKPFLAAGKTADSQQLLAAAEECWRQPEREFQYTATLLLRKWSAKLEPHQLETRTSERSPSVEQLIATKSWWDTVDSLAPWTVGPMVTAHPELVKVLDQWISHDNIWLARTALLFQLGYKERTDPERLFSYASLRAADTEFFIRKAIGWALRQYARQDPDAVMRFVADHEDQLSGLSKREALKHLQ